MMRDRSLRAADPAADWRADPASTQAQTMLAGILATPRDVPNELSGRSPAGQRRTSGQAWRRRMAFGGAAVAVALAMSTLWNGEQNGPAPAYAVTTNLDGSVELLVQWEELDDVAGLAATLREAGVPTEVTSSKPERYCATPADRDRASEALNKMNSKGEPASLDGYVMAPRLFPEDSTLAISTFFDKSNHMVWTMFYLAPTGSTSCALSGLLGKGEYTGPEPRPTRITAPDLSE